MTRSLRVTAPSAAPLDAFACRAIAPSVLIVMFVSNNRTVMGERTNGRRLNVHGWGTTAVMAVAAIALVVITIAGQDRLRSLTRTSGLSDGRRPVPG